jgi:hypothetical protein
LSIRLKWKVASGREFHKESCNYLDSTALVSLDDSNPQADCYHELEASPDL